VVEITKGRSPFKILIPEPKKPVSEVTAWHATVAFQDTVLDPDVQPGEITQALDNYRMAMTYEGEQKSRQIAASQQLRESEDFIKQTIGRYNPEAAATAILSLPYRDTALEETSIDNQVNYSVVTEEALGPIEYVDTVAETEKKFAHVQRELQKVVKDVENSSLLEKAADFGGTFLFWNNIRSRVGLDDTATLLDYVNPLQAGKVNEEVYDLMLNTRTYEEFVPKFNEYYKNLRERSGTFGENDLLILQGLDRLLSYVNPSAISYTNLESAFDFADMAGLGFAALKTPAAIARISGNPRVAGILGRNNPHNGLNGVNQMPGQPNLSISQQIQQQSQDIQKYINNHFDEISKYKNPDQLNQIQALTKDTAETVFPNRVIDVRWQRADATGAPQFTEFMDVYLGTQKGTGFSTFDWADNQAQAMGLNNYSVVQDPTTRKFLIKTERRPTESRNLLRLDMDDISTNWFKSWTAGARQLVSGRMSGTAALGELRQGVLAEKFMPLLKNIEGLNKQAKRDFNEVTTKGLNTGSGKWYNDQELISEYQLAFNRNPTQKEVDAYHSFRAISDAEWEIRNRALRETLAFENWRELDVSGTPTLARLTDRVPTGVQVFDVAGNPVTVNPGDVVVQLMEGVSNPNGGLPMSFVKLNRATDLKELPTQVLGRADGGRRFYDAEYFIKQANNIPTSDGVHVFHPRVGGAVKTAKEGRELADAMNDASETYRLWSSGQITNAQADSMLARHRTLAAMDITRLDDMVQNGHWDINQRWEVTPDQGLPTATNVAKASTNSIDYTTNISDNVLFSDRIGRMYYSTRGETLKSLETGNPVPTVNVFESLSRGVSSAIRTGAWNKYRIEQINSWATTVKELNALGNPEIINQTPWEILKTGVIKHADPKIEAKLKEAQKQILWNIDPATVDSHRLDSIRRAAREWIYDRDGVIKNYPNLTDFIENRVITNPITALRGITFDRHVGMFGIDQLIVQSNTLMTAAATYGTRAVVDTIPWTLALRAAETTRGFKGAREFDSFLGQLARSHNIPTTELRRRMKAMDAIGVLKVGGEMADLQQMGNYVESSRIIGAVDKVRQKGRVFFNWAEQNNRLVAFNIAYDMAKRQGLDPLSQDGLAFLALKTQDFSLNMTRSATAQWQRGVPSVFTQFFGYTGRYIDSLYGKQFTGMQKVKFTLANMIMFGAMGVPFGQNLIDTLGPDTPERIRQGAIDAILSEIMGVDTAFSTRVSPAQQIEQLTRDILMEGTAAIFATPAGDTVLDVMNLFRPFGKAWNVQYAFRNPDPLTIFAKSSLDAITDLVTPWNRWEKAWFIYQTQRIEDRLGRKVLESTEGYNTSAAIAAALGIQLQEVDQLYREYSNRQIEENLFDKPLSESIGLNWNKSFWGAVDNNDSKYEQGRLMVEIIGATLDEDPARKQRVLNEAQRLFATEGSREWNAEVATMRRGY